MRGSGLVMSDVIGMERDWYGAGLAGGAELSRSLFVSRSANEKMSEKGSLEFGGERENGLKDQLERQATKRSLERKRHKRRVVMVHRKR